jgi:acyl-CoA thioester hydrolase
MRGGSAGCLAAAGAVAHELSAPFVHGLRVRYGECDAQGVVFNANYFSYFDIAMTELWRAAIGSYDAMVDRGVDMVVAEAHARYLAPARFDDELDIAVTIERLGNTSTTTRHHVRRDGELLVDGSMRHVFVDAESLRKTPIPDWIREPLEPFVVESADTDAAV